MSDVFAIILLSTWFIGWIGLMYELFSNKFDYDNFVWVAFVILCPVVNFVLWLVIYTKRIAKSGMKGYIRNIWLRIKKFFTDDLIGLVDAIKNLVSNV